jgi:hypothetical protein
MQTCAAISIILNSRTFSLLQKENPSLWSVNHSPCPFPQTLAATRLLLECTDLPILRSSYKWNHTTCGPSQLCVMPNSEPLTFSRSEKHLFLSASQYNLSTSEYIWVHLSMQM